MDYYYMSGSAPCCAVAMTAKALNIEFNKKLVNLRKGEHLKPEFLKINPQHTVPTLVDGQLKLLESRAIMVYLVEKYGKNDTLYPKDPQKQAVVNQRLYFDMGTLYKSFSDYIFPQLLAKAPADPEKYKKMEEAVGFLNTFLEGHAYAAGDSLTLADIALVASMTHFVMMDFDLGPYPNVAKWFENCKKNLPGFQANWDECLEMKKMGDGQK